MLIFIGRLPLIFILFIFINARAQDTLKTYYFPQVNWTLKIPAASTFLDSAEFDIVSQNAANAISKMYEEDVSFEGLKQLFTIRQGQFNLLGGTINVYDTTSGMTVEESYAMSKNMVVQVIVAQAPAIKLIDSASGYEMIDGLRFEKLYLKTFYPERNLTMHTYWFYRKQNEYDLSINVVFTDERIGMQFLDLLRNSKFGK